MNWLMLVRVQILLRLGMLRLLVLLRWGMYDLRQIVNGWLHYVRLCRSAMAGDEGSRRSAEVVPRRRNSWCARLKDDFLRFCDRVSSETRASLVRPRYTNRHLSFPILSEIDYL